MNQKLFPLSKRESAHLYKGSRSELFTKFSAGVCLVTRPLIYQDVEIENADVLKYFSNLNHGALIIPNHIENEDTIAIGTKLYELLGISSHFVMKPQMKPHAFFELMGGIPFERGCDLKKAYRKIESMNVSDEEKSRLMNKRLKLHHERQFRAYKMVTHAINAGDFVTMYLQGHRKPGQTTNIGQEKYQLGLNNWLDCMGTSPKPVIPLNVEHFYEDDPNPFYRRKSVRLTVGDPIMQTEGLEAVTEHLVKNIDVFYSTKPQKPQ